MVNNAFRVFISSKYLNININKCGLKVVSVLTSIKHLNISFKIISPVNLPTNEKTLINLQ